MSAIDIPQSVPQGGTAGSSYGGEGRKPLEMRSEGELSQLNDEWFQRVTGNRAHVERQALLSLSFFLGQQYVGFPRGEFRNRLVHKKAPKGRVRTTENIITPAMRSEKARLLRSRPTGTTLPQGNDPQDIEAAAAADDLLQHIRREYDREVHTSEAVDWSLTAGTGHVAIGWDEFKKDKRGEQGDFDFRVLSPFEFGVPKLRETDIEKQPYVMVTKMYEIDEIEERWGVRITGSSDGVAGSLDDKLSSIMQGTTYGDPAFSFAISGSRANAPKVDTAVVKETWIKPSPMAPDGAVLITAGGKLLDLTPWPMWCKGQYPFAKYLYTEVPGAYWGRGFVEDLIPIQRRHNRAASIVIETMNLYAMLSVAAPKNTKVKGILGGRGALFEMPLGSTQPALNVQPPPVGDLPFRELENTRVALRDIASQHEVSKGFTPPNVRSGTAINLLKEIDDSASIMAQRSIERAEQKLGQMTLDIVQEKWNKPRFILVLGNNGDIERNAFLSGGDIGGQYHVQAGSAWPYAKAEKIQYVMQMWEQQLISAEEALDHLDLGTTASSIMQERKEDQRHARRENQKFEALSVVQGQGGQADLNAMIDQARSIAPEMWHNHEAHIREHNKLRKSAVYETWPLLRKLIFEAHVQGHMSALLTIMQSGMGPMATAAGSAGGDIADPRDQAVAAQRVQGEASAPMTDGPMATGQPAPSGPPPQSEQEGAMR